MDMSFLALILASVVSNATPLIFASMGETITERAGIVNLSLDGTILLSAMVAFAVALTTASLALGFLAAMLVGVVMALVVAFGSIRLHQDQVAIGFVLTLLGAELSSFLGSPFTRLPGPTVPYMPIPYLADLPLLGPVLFRHNLIVYISFILVALSWFYFFRTQPGLHLRAIGERPEAAFVRGMQVSRLRFFYTAIGGALVGFAGAAYSLSIKPGWSHGHTAGFGWVALVIVIFGGWHPVRAALGAYLFGVLGAASIVLPRVITGIPSQFWNAAPFTLMLIVLVLSGRTQRVQFLLFGGAPPAALGRPFFEGEQ